MRYYINYPFGIDTILDKKLRKLDNFNSSDISNADFIYTRLRSFSYKNKDHSTYKKFYKKYRYVNNFLDYNNKLCVTGDNCLANKVIFFFQSCIKKY